MVVEPIGSATAGVRVAPVPILRKAGRSASASINPFSPDGAPANPLADMVTLSLKATRLSSETAVPARLFNSLYFMYPNASIRDFAFEVVGIHKTDSNDVKMGKIARWVQRHILYREDLPNYGYEEFWAPPAFTLRKGSGDCEDGAFPDRQPGPQCRRTRAPPQDVWRPGARGRGGCNRRAWLGRISPGVGS
jgi:predicted transglutaminase-like cysteine proteinase